jgi:hypothetical protein
VVDVAGGQIQCSEETLDAVADVVVGAAGRGGGQHRQARLGPVQGLDLTLFIHAEHDRAFGRVQVEPDPLMSTSWTFSMNSGSPETLTVSSRWGWRP